MADNDILRRVIKVTAGVLALDPETIQPSSNFVLDLAAESVQSVELVSAFEEEFGIEMDEDAALSVETVEGAAEFIAKYVNKSV